MNTIRFKNAELTTTTKVQIQDLFSIPLPIINRLATESKSKVTIKPYAIAVDRLVRFHDFNNPRDLDKDEAMDFFVYPKHVNWFIINWVIIYFPINAQNAIEH